MIQTGKLIQQINRGQSVSLNLLLKASICHKSKLPPKTTTDWPYETRSYNIFNFFLDPRTKKKFNENSKIIQVEGNVAAGKDNFAKLLAEELGMKYFPEINLEEYYINDHGYDYRALNPLLPERLRICDWEMFHECPNRHSVIHMQYCLFKLRTFQYIKVLQHIFNTGQGVVLNRSVWTEPVFVEAMDKIGWLPKGYLRGDGARFYDWKNYYNFSKNMTISPLHRPHLTIYIKVPVEKCLERIRKSPDPMIANSKALVPEFLEAIESSYEKILDKQEHSGHVLKYDVDDITRDDVNDIIDDIETLDFTYDPHDSRFAHWDESLQYFWHTTVRMNYTNCEGALNPFIGLPYEYHDIAGLGDSITQADVILRTSLFEAHVKSLGRFVNASYDRKLVGWMRSIFGYDDFGTKLRKSVRSDFV